MNRRIVILTEGYSNPHTAKTGCSVLRYRPDEVVALLDGDQAGRTTGEVLGVGGNTPFIERLDQAPEANTLLIGIAPPGGGIPAAWRPTILEAINRGLDVVSGLHDFLTEDDEFVAAARQQQVTLTDVRKNRFKSIARRLELDENCLRVHTVGHDCSVGKMVTAIEVVEGLKRQGRDAKFIATGQTGIMVEGDGLPVDCIVADFVSGAAERLVLDQQHHEIVVVEGQGSLVHPSYSGVTLGLLHGCSPHAMIFCFEVGRERVTGVEHISIPPLAQLIPLYETMASLMQPSKVIGISMNSRRVDAETAESERERLSGEFGLPVCDVFRHGPDELVAAVLQFQQDRRR